MPEEAQEELIELKNDSTDLDLFRITPLNDFWVKMSSSYPLCAAIAYNTLLPFSTSYLYEAGFSAMILLKPKVEINST